MTKTFNVAASTSAIQLASDGDKKQVLIYNDSTSTLYISLGGIASLTNWSCKLPPSSFWEIPTSHTGDVSGIWVSANGSAHITIID